MNLFVSIIKNTANILKIIFYLHYKPHIKVNSFVLYLFRFNAKCSFKSSSFCVDYGLKFVVPSNVWCRWGCAWLEELTLVYCENGLSGK